MRVEDDLGHRQNPARLQPGEDLVSAASRSGISPSTVTSTARSAATLERPLADRGVNEADVRDSRLSLLLRALRHSGLNVDRDDASVFPNGPGKRMVSRRAAADVELRMPGATFQVLDDHVRAVCFRERVVEA
jgi:hypothetical protein